VRVRDFLGMRRTVAATTLLACGPGFKEARSGRSSLVDPNTPSCIVPPLARSAARLETKSARQDRQVAEFQDDQTSPGYQG